MSYFEPIDYNNPVDYFEQYDRYRYQDPEYGNAPLKEDWWWELNKPTSDTQTMSRVRYTAPLNDEFSRDAFWAVDPILRGPLAEALREGEGNAINAYDIINTPDYQQALLDRIGKTEWNQLRAAGVLPEEDLPGEELDKLAADYYNSGLENALATGDATMQRNAGVLDELSQRYGGRPYPGGELSGFQGPGFGGVGAPEQGGQGQPAGGPGGPAGAGGGMPDMAMQQALGDAVSQAPGLEMTPRNAYHVALQRRLQARGYRGSGGGGRDTRQFFRRNAEKEGSRQNRREVAKFFNRGVRRMNSRPSGRRNVKLHTNARRKPSGVNPRTLASYYGK